MPEGAVRSRVEGRAWSRWFEPLGVGAVLVMLLAPALVLVLGGSAAEAANGSALPAFDQEPAVGHGRLPAAIVSAPAAGSLGIFSSGIFGSGIFGSGAQSLTCVQTPVAVDAAGRTGVLAPQIGVTVIRGAAAASPSLTWVVVPVGQLGSDGQVAVTVCTPTR